MAMLAIATVAIGPLSVPAAQAQELEGSVASEEVAQEPTTSPGERVGRLSAELLGAGVVGFAGFLVGVGIGRSDPCGFSQPDDDGDGQIVCAMFGGCVGAAATVPMGVWLAGSIAGGEGSLGWTYLPMGIAAAVSVYASVIDSEAGVVTFLVSGSVALIATMFAYEVSSDAAEEQRSALRLRPTASVAPDGSGLSLGFVGIF